MRHGFADGMGILPYRDLGGRSILLPFHLVTLSAIQRRMVINLKKDGDYLGKRVEKRWLVDDG